MNTTMEIKKSFLNVVFLVTYVLSIGCSENTQEITEPTPWYESISFTSLDGDHSDIELKKSFGFDTHVYGSFEYTKNDFYHPKEGYNFQSNWYKASYEGNAVANSKINNSFMCATSRCDSSDLIRNGFWHRYGESASKQELTWEFISLNTFGGYRVIMDEFPEKIQLTGVPATLSRSGDNTITFTKGSKTDSILFELIVIPKENLGKADILGKISSQHHFPVKAAESQIIIPGELIKKVVTTSQDTVFVNLVSLRRVVKIIKADKMAVTYRINNIYPVKIQ